MVGYLSGTPTLVAGGNGPGSLSTQLYYPVGLAFDVSSNSLYISNYYSHSIVRWILGAPMWTVVVGVPGSSSNTPLQLSIPQDFIFDHMGNLYVADHNNHRIQLFVPGSLNGMTIAGVTSFPGSAANQLWYPYSVALDSDLNLYVADLSNNRVQKFLRY